MKKLLVILPRVPYPIEKGDKLRAYYQLKQFANMYEVHLVALSDGKIHPDAITKLQPYCKSIHIHKLTLLSKGINILSALLRGKPMQVGYFYKSAAHRKTTELIKELKPDHIFCQLLRSAEYAINSAIPKTIDYQDVFSKGIERRIKKAPFYLKAFFKLEHKRLVDYEAFVFDKFNHKVIISEQDRDLIQHPKKKEIDIIRNGVDFDFFSPRKKEKKYDLVFTGNMAYPPNIDAVVYIAKHILPLVRKHFPNIKLLIAGASPHPKVQALASDNVIVSGWLDDIRDAYAEGKIFLAPMQIGTGLQNKLLEAMSMQLPCITSKLANNALGAKHNENILLGNKPEEYSKHIITLLNKKDVYEKISSNGHIFVKKNFDWESVTLPLMNKFNN